MSSESSVATSSSSLNSGTVVYQASYFSSDWHGLLAAYGLTGGNVNTTAIWPTANPDQNSSNVIASFGTRVILTSYSGTGTAGGPATGKGARFAKADSNFYTYWSGLTGVNDAVLDWLRGDSSNEVRSGGLLRNRPISVLGDIVDSGPIFAWHENFAYASLPEGMSAPTNYPTFIATKANRVGSIYTGQGMVYVGANDGMLHGFDAGTGHEVFGYVPHSVIASLPALTDRTYTHQFSVDQTPYVGDANTQTPEFKSFLVKVEKAEGGVA